MTYKKRCFNHFLTSIIVAEIILLGGGQMLHIVGPMTLRMLLWSIAIVSILVGNQQLVESSVRKSVSIYVISMTIPFCVGLLTADLSAVFEDIKPLSYFIIILFFLNSINDFVIIERIFFIVKWCTFIMAVLYFVYCIFVILGYINVYVAQPFLPREDFMFRNDEGYFFYKGFVFLPIGMMFFFRKKITSILAALIFLITIFFTYTRGFYIMAFFAMFLYMTTNRKGRFIIPVLLSILVLYIVVSAGVLDVFEDRAEESNSTRIITFIQVLGKINPLSLIIGHGFGNGVPLRPGHFECSYLEIFHKQGLLGLSFWIYLFVSIKRSYNKLSYEDREMVKPFYVGVLLVFIQSLFNPYINNPIGMGFVLVSWSIMIRIRFLRMVSKTKTNNYNLAL